MKKLIGFITVLFMFFLGVQVQAQPYLNAGEAYKAFNGFAGDTLQVSADSSEVYLYKTYFLGKKDFKYNYFIEADLKRDGSYDYVDVILRGSSNGVKYYDLGTVRWASTADTTVTFDSFNARAMLQEFNVQVASDSLGVDTITNSLSTTYLEAGQHWRYLQLYFTSDSLGANMSINKTGGPIRFRVLPY